jgi:SAM-dependent methyltransferase
MPAPTQMPSPVLFFETVSAYQRSEAIKAAVELGIFGAIGAEAQTAAVVADRCKASERGTRILCDFLVINGFLLKEDGRYRLTTDSAVFLDPKSPAYMGGALEFLAAPALKQKFAHLADCVRKGGTVEGAGSLEPEHPMWMDFARGMAAVTGFPAQAMAGALGFPKDRALKVLDVAASHGMFGIAVAKEYSKARIVAQDWKNVLAVASENAKKCGVADRLELLPGSVFDVDLGSGYDVVLLTNFLHHFDRPAIVGLLKKFHKCLVPGGRVMTLEFVPNDDRISPPAQASFSLTMLASTPSGDAYTFRDLDGMFRDAGFARSEVLPLEIGMQQVILSTR